MNCKTKLFMTKKKAFTLIELLIVIAIIGILFIVLVSKVDFATDKAKATGVQTDFRSFQMAFDTVAKENAGFNTFGWDTGDANQDGIRNSYDEGDNGAGGGTAKNGIQDGDEVFTGHKVYDETFTKIFSLKKNGTGSYDRDALNRLETAINANLDPKLHITIADDGTISMANGAQDPWNKEYHGWYITNAEVDGKDRGAIVMYSDGANNEFGSEHKISNGVVSISIPGNNKYGKDDYAVCSVYTYVNGYGEIKNVTSGFSANQNGFSGFESEKNDTNDAGNINTYIIPEGGIYYVQACATNDQLELAQYDISTVYRAGDPFPEPQLGDVYIYGDYSYAYGYSVEESRSHLFWTDFNLYGQEPLSWGVGVTNRLDSDKESKDAYGEILSNIAGKPVNSMSNAFDGTIITNIPVIPSSIKNTFGAFRNCDNLVHVIFPEGLTVISESTFILCDNLTTLTIPSSVVYIGDRMIDVAPKFEKVIYDGTIAQWQALTNNINWHTLTHTFVVQCTNGMLTIN